MTDFRIKTYKWHQIREQVTQAETELGQIIDDWDPGPEYTLTEFSFPFGTHILDIYNGGYQIPTEDGETVPFNDHAVPNSLKTQLGYNSLPLGIITQGGVEVYHQLNDRIFSLAYLGPGLNLGIWESFSSPAPYSVSSGARSLIMVPKITDTENHKRLKKDFDIRYPAPRHLFDQWLIFTELAKVTKTPWDTKILFLNRKWLDPKKKNIGWLNFYNYLCQRAWQHTEYARTKTVLLEINWKHFCSILKEKGERFDPYLLETLRHIVFVSQGILPGFAAVGASEIYGPVNFIMSAYINSYLLKNYIPTMLAPAHFSRTFSDKVPVYYSFQNPTMLESIPKIKGFSSAIDDMRDFKNLMDYFVKENLYGELKFGNDALCAILKNIRFDYFHSEMYSYGGIRPTAELPKDDLNLIYMPSEIDAREFADKASFFRCCIRISSKKYIK